ncbi:MAG: LemA family protein [Acidobacteria bacterium]|nr:MAG: LemA family protein [Acidobacteriota bacterium]
MSKRRTLLLSLAVLTLVFSSGCGYNTLQSKQQNVRAKWANIETVLQRRADLIPNLFEAAKAAGFQEQQVFGDIAKAREGLLAATKAPPQGDNGDKSPEQKQAVIDANNTLSRLLVIVENYPQLRSSESFQKLQDSLEGTENRIAVAREDYNTAVQDYNTTRGSFPTVIGAKIYGFKEEPYFKADPTATQVPKIDANSVRPSPATK